MLTCSSRNTLARSFVYQVGKSTLVRSLVRHYTRQNVNEVQGPITVVSGKRRRLTLIECPNDISSMMDVAKVADLVLLMIDAHYGFEMETFEFLNILQVHGFPKVMGVLSHLDLFKSTKLVARKKKELKQRFWTEIYQVRRCLLVCSSCPRTKAFNALVGCCCRRRRRRHCRDRSCSISRVSTTTSGTPRAIR